MAGRPRLRSRCFAIPNRTTRSRSTRKRRMNLRWIRHRTVRLRSRRWMVVLRNRRRPMCHCFRRRSLHRFRVQNRHRCRSHFRRHRSLRHRIRRRSLRFGLILTRLNRHWHPIPSRRSCWMIRRCQSRRRSQIRHSTVIRHLIRNHRRLMRLILMHLRWNRLTLSHRMSIHPKSNHARTVIRPTPSSLDRRQSRFHHPTCFGRTCHFRNRSPIALSQNRIRMVLNRSMANHLRRNCR